MRLVVTAFMKHEQLLVGLVRDLTVSVDLTGTTPQD